MDLIASAYCSARAIRVSNMRAITFLFVGQSSSRRLEEIGEDRSL